MWDLPWSGIEPVSPAIAGRFFTAEPPGKPEDITVIKNLLSLFVAISNNLGTGSDLIHCQLLLGPYCARENNSCWEKPPRIWKLLLKHNLSDSTDAWVKQGVGCWWVFMELGLGRKFLMWAYRKGGLDVTERWVTTWHSIAPKLTGHRTRNTYSKRKVMTTWGWPKPGPQTLEICMAPPGMTDACIWGPLGIIISFKDAGMGLAQCLGYNIGSTIVTCLVCVC